MSITTKSDLHKRKWCHLEDRELTDKEKATIAAAASLNTPVEDAAVTQVVEFSPVEALQEELKSLRVRVEVLERPVRAQITAAALKRQRAAEVLTSQVAAMLLRGEVTEGQLKTLPIGFSRVYENLIGPDWLDKVILAHEVLRQG